MQVENLDQLDVLPIKTVLRDSTGQVWERWAVNCWCSVGNAAGRRSHEMGMYPFTVLFMPEEKVGGKPGSLIPGGLGERYPVTDPMDLL